MINSGSNNTQIQINQTGTTTPQQNAANLCPNTGDGITGTGNSNCAPAGRTYRDSNGTPLIFGSSQAELACQQAYNGDTCYARNSSVDVWHCSCQSPNSTSNRNIICTDKYGNKGPVTGPNNTGSACSPSQVCSGTITLTNLNITAPGWNQICHANSSQQSNTSSNIGKPCGCTPGANNDNCNGFGQPTSSNGTCKSGQNGIPNGCYENENQCGTWGPVGVLQQNVCCFPSAQASVKVNLSNGNANPTANTITSLLSVATHVGRSAQVPLASNGQGVLGASMTTIPLTSAYNPETGQYESQSLNFSTIPDGSYDFLLHVDGYLNARLQPTDGTGYFIIKNGQLTQSIEPIQLTPGDILPLPHGDNIIDQQDYDMIVKCINKDPACTPQIKQIADLDKDGDVDNTELQLVQKALGESGDTFPTPPPCPTGQSLTGLGCIPNNPIGFTAKLFVIGLSLIGGIATLFIIYGGYLILFSQGNSSQIQRGKRYLTSAITGLLFFILAASFFEFVTLNILHLPGIGK
ncbi:MAG TPA: dockerin type I domain-containing protein [Patescibacteria group bacterium]|nr:dockerin type I domain-containing protein [Patescibacteria group bacterium]